jgi:hypothetical protein
MLSKLIFSQELQNFVQRNVSDGKAYNPNMRSETGNPEIGRF